MLSMHFLSRLSEANMDLEDVKGMYKELVNTKYSASASASASAAS